MSPDGAGKPDAPVTVRVAELECLSCVTPIGNVSIKLKLACKLYNLDWFNQHLC